MRKSRMDGPRFDQLVALVCFWYVNYLFRGVVIQLF